MKNYEITIDGYGHSGEGVGRLEGRPVFVKGAIAGERIGVAETERKKNYSRAEIVRIICPAAARITPLCPVYGICGGCQLQHMNYAEQLRFKHQAVVNAITRIGGLPENLVSDIVDCDNRYNYRNKMQLPVQKQDGDLRAGFYASGTHRVTDIDNCPIQLELNNKIMRLVKKIAAGLNLQPYDEHSGSGWLRHIAARCGENSAEAMLVLVTGSADFPEAADFVQQVRAGLPEVTSIVQNINPQKTNIIFGNRERLLWGKPVIYERLCGLRYEISAKSFFQVNSRQAEKLFALARTAARLNKNDILLDAYCGAGVIGLSLADSVQKVIGIEISATAVENARRNATNNGITNAEYYCGDVGTVLSGEYIGELPNVVILDPPRSGCSAAELALYTTTIKPERIVYVSCNPSTLARDLKILGNGGYTCQSVTPVDMFPQTYHVECVAVLERTG